MKKYVCDKCKSEFENDELETIVKDGGPLTREELAEICERCLEKLKKYLTKSNNK